MSRPTYRCNSITPSALAICFRLEASQSHHAAFCHFRLASTPAAPGILGTNKLRRAVRAKHEYRREHFDKQLESSTRLPGKFLPMHSTAAALLEQRHRSGHQPTRQHGHTIGITAQTFSSAAIRSSMAVMAELFRGETVSNQHHTQKLRENLT